MMDKRRSGQFKVAGSMVRFAFLTVAGTATAAILLSSCATVNQSSETTPVMSAPSPAPVLGVGGLSGSLSKVMVPDGSLVIVRVTAEAGLSEKNPGVLPTGEFEETRFPFFAGENNQYVALFGVPHHHAPGASKVIVRLGKEALELPFMIVDAGYSSEKLHVTDESKIKPPKSQIARILLEQKEIGEAYTTLTPNRFWKGGFRLPIDSAITSHYGTKRLYNGELKSFHTGLDLRAKIGTPVFTAAPGVVVLAKDLYFTGKTVIVDHGYGLMTLYAHLETMEVKKGQVLGPGERLGLSGATGRVSGPHLHWMAIVHRVKFNPLDLMQLQ